MTQKQLLALLILTASIAGGWYWASQKGKPAPATPPVTEGPVSPTQPETPIDTSDWKTYRNEEFGFEFRYPENKFDLKELFIPDPVGLFNSPIPSQFIVYIVERSYSIDDQKHQLRIALNLIRSEKEVSFELRRDTVSIPVKIGSKIGKIYSSEEDALVRQGNMVKFVGSGICDPEPQSIIFNEIKHPDGDFRSHIYIGCENPEMGKTYQLIFQSIRFIE